MKKTKIIGLIFILLIISLTAVTTVFSEVFSEKIEGEELLIQMFEKTNANIEELNIYTSLHIKNNFFEMDHMKNILYAAIAHFKLNESVKDIIILDYYEIDIYEEEQLQYERNTLYVTRIEEEGFNQLYSFYLDEEGNLSTFKIYSLKYDDNESDSYIIIDILQNKRYKDMVSLLNTSKEFLLKYGENIDTTTTLVGTFDRKLSNSQTNKIISRILRSLGAEMVEKVDDGFYTAVTAYTPYIEQSVHFFNKTVNLNIAIRYNAYEDLTYIIIATPLITTTY